MPKAGLSKMGICGETVRLPLITTTDSNKKLLFDAMDEFEKKGY
jgi:4-hydroxy-tetrahydrodipicolinate synthase